MMAPEQIKDDFPPKTYPANEKPANQPELRFAGFTGDWEKRKLSEILEIASRKNGEMYTKQDVLSVSDEFGCVNQIKFQGRSFAGEDISNYKVVQTGDIIYTRSPLQAKPYGIIKIVGDETGIVSPLYIVNVTTEGNDPKFIYYCFDTPLKTNNYLSPLVRKGAKNTMNISNAEWLSGEIIVSPYYEEQKRIAEFLTGVDNLISLYQRNLEKLRNIKNACLEKMFPQNGSKYPEIRFTGFTGAWEQRKLKELVCFSKGSGYSKADLRDSGTPIILYGRLYTKYETVISSVDTFSEAKAGSVYSRGGEVIVPASGETAEDISIASVVEKSGVLLGGDLNIITPSASLDSVFLAISISNGKPREDMAKMAQGKSVVHLHNTDLAKIDLMYPNYTEQVKISGFFRSLDNLITLQQRKLEKLRNIKKASLEKMFI